MIGVGLAVALAVSSATPRVAVVVHTTGFADDDARHVQDKAGQEVASTGVELWALSKSLEVKTECLTDHACAKEVLRTADAAFLVWIEAVRAGGQVELEAHLLDAEGRSVAQGESAARADDVVGAGAVVATAVLTPLKQAAAAAAHAASTSSSSSSTSTSSGGTGGANAGSTTNATTSTTTPNGKIEPLTQENQPAHDEAGKPLSPLAIGGIAALGGGALLAIGGGAVAVSQLHVISDPGSLGAAKEDAATVAATMLGVAGVGVAGAAAGGVLLYLGM